MKFLCIESTKEKGRIPFTNIKDMVKKHYLKQHDIINKLTNNGKDFDVATNEDIEIDKMKYYNPAYEYMVILEDGGDYGVPSCNCIDSVSLVNVSLSSGKNKKLCVNEIFKISAAGYGVEFALTTINTAYDFLRSNNNGCK